jgi:hypothetical protein
MSLVVAENVVRVRQFSAGFVTCHRAAVTALWVETWVRQFSAGYRKTPGLWMLLALRHPALSKGSELQRLDIEVTSVKR